MLKKIGILFRELTKPIPLENDFSDYNDYWDNRGFDIPSLNRAKKISKYIKPKSSVLDIGCGDGTVMAHLLESKDLRKVVGIDISVRAVEYVKKRGLEAFEFDVLSSDFRKYIKPKKFDYIIITEVLEHIQDAEVLFSLLDKHVTESIFISIPNAGFFTNRLRLLSGKFPLVMIQEHVKEHIRFWTKSDFYYWANYHGYKIDAVEVTIGMGIKPLKPLENLLPGLFAKQLMYKMSRKND